MSMNNEKVPVRADVPDKFKWDLTHIFPSDEAWEKEYAALREMPAKVSAFSGRLGLELPPEPLSPEEAAFARTCASAYKRLRPVVQGGDLHRIASPCEGDHAALLRSFAGGAVAHGCPFYQVRPAIATPLTPAGPLWDNPSRPPAR